MTEGKKSSWGKKAFLTSATIVALGGATYFGEQVQPIETIKNKIEFHNVGPALGTPENFQAWRLFIEKDTQHNAVVKITDDSTTYILDKHLGPTTLEKQQTYHAIVHRTPAPGTPLDFLAGDISYNINKQGQVEVYFGNKNTQQYWKVNEDWTAGSIGEQVDKFFYQLFENTKEKGKEFGKALEEHLSRQYEKADSLVLEKKEEYFPVEQKDSTQKNFWEKLKENISESYNDLKDKL